MADGIGQHCAFCQRLDFLPHPCPHCHLIHCSEHAQPSSHSCSFDPSSRRVDPTQCGEKSSTIGDLFPDRNYVSEPPPKSAEDEIKAKLKLEALAILKRNFPKAGSAPKVSSNKPIKSKSRVIELSRLRNRATSGDPRKRPGDVPMSERLHLVVKAVQVGDENERKICEVFFAKNTNVGKVIDLVASRLDVENVNNSPDRSKHLHLFVPEQSETTTDSSPNGVILSTTHSLAQSNVIDGSDVWLVKGTDWLER